MNLSANLSPGGMVADSTFPRISTVAWETDVIFVGQLDAFRCQRQNG